MKNGFIGMAVALLVCILMLPCAKAKELNGKTAAEIVAEMGIGYNIGNTLDATGYNVHNIYGHETSWGNPVIDQALLQRIKDAGFDTVRIPITWYRHVSKDGTYTIDPAFMARVKEVVDYAYACDLYVIINMHHEAWINVSTLDKDYEQIGVQLSAMWKQVAEAFADYDQHLIFEGMNEPRMAGTSLEWTGNKAGFDAVNYLTQVFVDAVRTDAKGNNGERCLMIPGYAASSSAQAMAAIKLPMINGETAENLIVSVHCYSPYDFCLSDNQKTFDPENKGHTSSIDSVFENVERFFLNRGIPVVIGETGATNTDHNTAERAKWAYYMGSKAAAYGVPIVIWDNGHDGASGGECHMWLRRKVNEKVASQSEPIPYPELIEQLMAGAASVEWGSGRKQIVKPTMESSVGGTVIWGSEEGLTNKMAWDNSYIKLDSQAEWYAAGRSFALVYTGSGKPRLILVDMAKNQWIPVDPDSIEAVGDRQIAWFSCETVLAECKSFGVEEPEQLMFFSVMTTSGKITSYEISYVEK